MDLTLEVTKKESTDMSSFVKQMCSLKCKIKAVNGNISIVGIDERDVDNVIDSISEAFTIEALDIVPTVVTPEPEPHVITEDSIEFEKVEFSNSQVQEQANKLLRIIYWSMYSRNAKANDICNYLRIAGTEIAMRYNPQEPSKFEVGDIVDCNYGYHIKGEISGRHVHSVVCKIDDDGMVYVVPISKAILKEDVARYLPFSTNVDVEYTDARYSGGTVLLKMGRYINQLRVGDVLGHVFPKFFSKLLSVLPAVSDFIDENSSYERIMAEKMGDVENDDDIASFENGEEQAEETVDGYVGMLSPDNFEKGEEVKLLSGNSDNKAAEVTSGQGGKINAVKKDTAKKLPVEDYLMSIVADALNALDKSKPVEDQIDDFLDAIGMSKSEELVRNSFIAACIVKKICYESIIIELHNSFQLFREEFIKERLKEEFKKWLDDHPDVRENYPKISIMPLLKIFAKKMA